MSAEDDLFNAPVARRTDPDTSWDAAKAVTPAADSIREAVELFALQAGPTGFIDEELSAAFDATDSSSYRTRRAELTQCGEIVFAGRYRMNSNEQRCMVWVHRTHSWADPPAEKPRTLTDRLGTHANRLDEQAKQMKAEGRTAFADELRETAQLIRDALEAGRKAKKSAS